MTKYKAKSVGYMSWVRYKMPGKVHVTTLFTRAKYSTVELG